MEKPNKIENRGNLITCQNCGFKFKFNNSLDRDNWQLKEKYSCPVCKELYCNKPKIERQLFALQDIYLEKRDDKSFENLFLLLKKYSTGFIKKFYSGYLHLFQNDIEYYAYNSACLVTEDYIKDENYKVLFSFAGVLKGKIRQSIFCKEEKSSGNESINWEFEDGHASIYGIDTRAIDKIEETENKINLLNFVINLIKEVGTKCNVYEDYLRILALRHYFIAGEDKADRLFLEEVKNKNEEITQYKTYGRVGKYKYLKTLDILKKELTKIN